MPEHVPEAASEMFAQSRTCLAEIEGWLSGGEAAALAHAELEERLGERGRELLRLLHQDHLDLRAAREQRRADVTGADGAPRTRAEAGHRRGLTTVFGQVRVTRMAYRAMEAANLHPADAELNLPQEKHSHGLRRLAALEAARGSFGDAAQAITRATAVVIGKRQVEELARRASADIDAFCTARRPGPAPDETLLVLTFDGKGIVMRPEALREATAKAAAASRRKLATRLSPGEKQGRKRMAELAAVYNAIPVPRTPADIIAPPGQGGRARQPGPAAACKWLTASVTDDIATVIAAGFDEAERRDPGHRRTWVALVDGNNAQIEAITAEAKQRQVNHTHRLRPHPRARIPMEGGLVVLRARRPRCRGLGRRAGRQDPRRQTAQVVAGIRRRATTFGYTGAEREGADECARYLTAKKPWLDYATALAAGWPIATGVIEGACRWLVKDRMDITGARWGLAGAEAILKLRALIASGDFGEYWPFHLRQEHQRVHRSRYGLAA